MLSSWLSLGVPQLICIAPFSLSWFWNWVELSWHYSALRDCFMAHISKMACILSPRTVPKYTLMLTGLFSLNLGTGKKHWNFLKRLTVVKFVLFFTTFSWHLLFPRNKPSQRKTSRNFQKKVNMLFLFPLDFFRCPKHKLSPCLQITNSSVSSV